MKLVSEKDLQQLKRNELEENLHKLYEKYGIRQISALASEDKTLYALMAWRDSSEGDPPNISDNQFIEASAAINKIKDYAQNHLDTLKSLETWKNKIIKVLHSVMNRFFREKISEKDFKKGFKYEGKVVGLFNPARLKGLYGYSTGAYHYSKGRGSRSASEIEKEIRNAVDKELEKNFGANSNEIGLHIAIGNWSGHSMLSFSFRKMYSQGLQFRKLKSEKNPVAPKSSVIGYLIGKRGRARSMAKVYGAYMTESGWIIIALSKIPVKSDIIQMTLVISPFVPEGELGSFYKHDLEDATELTLDEINEYLPSQWHFEPK